MEQLLEREGVEVIDDQVQRFEQHFWDPAIELPDESNLERI